VKPAEPGYGGAGGEEAVTPSALWIELRALGGEVWSRSLGERARRGKRKRRETGWTVGQRPLPTSCPPGRNPA